MDGTIADFKGGVGRNISINEKPRECLEEGFYRNLKVIEGAKEAISMLENHFDVYIATKPKRANPYCLEEKMEWIREHFPSLEKKVFFTPNKALLKGYMLIDDHPKWSEFEGEFIQFNSEKADWVELANMIISSYYYMNR